ncbi:MAG: glycoside hydrolase family 99-like domain-containing protein [Fibrobacter sp.]|uniref:glycosyltransferase WbsX family protein n=1 Tax=Fibrobacter sp. TaxID=35828 RepID=UPI0025C12233|nr:glycoside hydrolase family 99-like domain-containing protein [Fibrobacter sp.]MBQ3714296.1 glycoside hydrolase family 99-like domain-containing protein [Fibrobacter sp.]MBQ7081887.1 glycoside hydrolase family 99-like domain-containing protein [Fibrobacter sp.]
MAQFVAFYLPQFHPVAENEKWYGPGFTEWTNVAKAKPLFRGHYQPHIPADLGFYDLRLPEVRRKQATMAYDAGVSAFCYWTYWFGAGKQLLEMPIFEVLKDKTITLPFCIAWANHSWEKKLWDSKGSKELIVEQRYLGEQDYVDFFYKMLPLFKDNRYFRVEGKLFVCIFDPLANAEIKKFINVWRELAKKESLGDFFFCGKDSACRNKQKIFSYGFDAVYDDNVYNIHHNLSMFSKVWLYFKRKYLKLPTIFKYKDAIKYMVTKDALQDDVFPVISPNWDHSPRSGRNSILLHDCKPVYFFKLVKYVISMLQNKTSSRQIVMIKAWNEWGEGNHMEPDLKYGRGYLDALKSAIDKKDFTND